ARRRRRRSRCGTPPARHAPRARRSAPRPATWRRDGPCGRRRSGAPRPRTRARWRPRSPTRLRGSPPTGASPAPGRGVVVAGVVVARVVVVRGGAGLWCALAVLPLDGHGGLEVGDVGLDRLLLEALLDLGADVLERRGVALVGDLNEVVAHAGLDRSEQRAGLGCERGLGDLGEHALLLEPADVAALVLRRR